MIRSDLQRRKSQIWAQLEPMLDVIDRARQGYVVDAAEVAYAKQSAPRLSNELREIVAQIQQLDSAHERAWCAAVHAAAKGRAA